MMPTTICWTTTTNPELRLLTVRDEEGTGPTLHGQAIRGADGWRLRILGIERCGPFRRYEELREWVIDNAQELWTEVAR
jgi:hypothetical protein